MPIVLGESLPRTEARREQPLPKEEKRNHPRFLAMVHPDRWVWDSLIKDWLPELGKLTISAGVQGVELLPNGQENPAMARAHYTTKGWMILEDGDPRLADVVPNGQYVSRFQAGNGWAYCFAWEGYERVRGSIEWGEDTALRVKFLKALIAKGFITPMSRKLKEVDIRETQKRVRRMHEKFALKPNFPSLKVRLEQAEALLADMYKAAGLRPDQPLGRDSAPSPTMVKGVEEIDPLGMLNEDDDIEPSVVGAPEVVKKKGGK